MELSTCTEVQAARTPRKTSHKLLEVPTIKLRFGSNRNVAHLWYDFESPSDDAYCSVTYHIYSPAVVDLVPCSEEHFSSTQ